MSDSKRIDISVDSYIQGRSDCEQGLPCPAEANEDYFNGYSDQYQSEQIATAKTSRGE